MCHPGLGKVIVILPNGLATSFCASISLSSTLAFVASALLHSFVYKVESEDTELENEDACED